MGLIGFVLAPLYHLVPIVYLPPLLFLKRPVTWFQAITRHKGTIAYAPNFAYALCVKRIKPTDLEGLDLSTWRVAGCGAEPIRPETLEGFADDVRARSASARRRCCPRTAWPSRRSRSRSPSSARACKTLGVERAGRSGSRGRRSSLAEDDENAVRLVSCGPEFPEHTIRVFDPDDAASERPLPEGKVGELRIAGPSVMRGYWEDAERTRESFAGRFLKTGDLGFLHGGHVFICGRSKEVVIVNGRNYYPQDMEWEASKVAGVRKGNVVAFGARDPSGVERDRERVVLAFEVQEPERIGADVDAWWRRCASRPGGNGAHPRRRGRAAAGRPAEDVERQAAARQDARALRDRRADGPLGRRARRARIDVAKQAAMSQLSYFKLAVLGGRKRKE